MAKTIYNTGDIVGKGLKFIKDLPPKKLPSGQSKRQCLFECPCGRQFEHALRPIEKGQCSNCGCGKGGYQKHGMTGTFTRRCWSHIKSRCLKSDHRAYKFYGARGITIYEPWINDFQAFHDYVSTLENFGVKGMTLDRINNDLNYEPGNLRWATRKTQANNRRPRKKGKLLIINLIPNAR